MARSINKVILIGNLTRDPELRYTPQGHAVCTFGIATNREWVSDGERKESADFHNVVSWNKLAELCSQLLHKGSKTYVEGRLQTRNWDGDDGVRRYKTEIVIDEMVVLTSRSANSFSDAPSQVEEVNFDEAAQTSETDVEEKKEEVAEDVSSEEVPF